MSDREVDLSKPLTLTDPLAAATDQRVDDDGTVTINVGTEHAGATVDVGVSRVGEDEIRTDGGQPTAGPGEFVFESNHEKGTLTGLMTATAIHSVLSVGLLKRYPKWGARYLLIQAVLAALAAVSYARGTVDSPEADQ